MGRKDKVSLGTLIDEALALVLGSSNDEEEQVVPKDNVRGTKMCRPFGRHAQRKDNIYDRDMYERQLVNESPMLEREDPYSTFNVDANGRRKTIRREANEDPDGSNHPYTYPPYPTMPLLDPLLLLDTAVRPEQEDIPGSVIILKEAPPEMTERKTDLQKARLFLANHHMHVLEDMMRHHHEDAHSWSSSGERQFHSEERNPRSSSRGRPRSAGRSRTPKRDRSGREVRDKSRPREREPMRPRKAQNSDVDQYDETYSRYCHGRPRSASRGRRYSYEHDEFDETLDSMMHSASRYSSSNGGSMRNVTKKSKACLGLR